MTKLFVVSKSEEYLEAVKKTPYMTLEDLQEFTKQYGDVYFHPVCEIHNILADLLDSPVNINNHMTFLFALVEHLSLCQAGFRGHTATGRQCNDREGEEWHGSGQVRLLIVKESIYCICRN